MKAIPVIESAPWPSSVKSAVACVVPVDESSRLLTNEAAAAATAIVAGESHIGQRHTDDYGKGGNQQGEPQGSQSKHRALLV